MSYAFNPAAEFRSALALLPPWLGEETLDEIELVLRNPTQLKPRDGSGVAIHDFTRTRDSRIHYIFLTVRVQHGGKSLEFLRLGHVERSAIAQA